MNGFSVSAGEAEMKSGTVRVYAAYDGLEGQMQVIVPQAALFPASFEELLHSAKKGEA